MKATTLQTEQQQQAIFSKNNGDEPVAKDTKGYKPPTSAKKKAKSDLDLFAWLGDGATRLTFAAANMSMDEKTQEQMRAMNSAVKMVGGALGGVSATAFVLQSAFMGVDVVSSAKHSIDSRKAKSAANAADLADKPAAKVAAEAVVDAADKPVAKAVTEAAVDATGAAAKQGVKATEKAAIQGAVDASVKLAAHEAMEASATVAAKSSAKLGARAIPIVAAFVTAGFAIHEVAGFIGQGKYKQAFGAALGGTAQTIGSVGGVFTLAAGEAARDGIHALGVWAGGKEMEEVAVSDARALYRSGKELTAHFTQAGQAPTALAEAQITTMEPNIANRPAAGDAQSQTVLGLNLQKVS